MPKSPTIPSTPAPDTAPEASPVIDAAAPPQAPASSRTIAKHSESPSLSTEPIPQIMAVRLSDEFRQHVENSRNIALAREAKLNAQIEALTRDREDAQQTLNACDAALTMLSTD